MHRLLVTVTTQTMTIGMEVLQMLAIAAWNPAPMVPVVVVTPSKIAAIGNKDRFAFNHGRRNTGDIGDAVDAVITSNESATWGRPNNRRAGHDHLLGLVQPETAVVVQGFGLLHPVGIRCVGSYPCCPIHQGSLGDIRTVAQQAGIVTGQALRITNQGVAVLGDIALHLFGKRAAKALYPSNT